jgi:hypothetical protein
MKETNQAMAAIHQWQKWYRDNKIVADPEEPLVAKDQRHNLHDTTNVSATLNHMTNQNLLTEATNYFADTIAEYTGALSGKEIYKAFYAAACAQYEFAKKEYKQAEDLINMLRCDGMR